jgi:hypothetical protein
MSQLKTGLNTAFNTNKLITILLIYSKRSGLLQLEMINVLNPENNIDFTTFFILLILLLNSSSDRIVYGSARDYIKLGADATGSVTYTVGVDNDTT